MHAHMLYGVAQHAIQKSKPKIEEVAKEIAKNSVDNLDFSKLEAPLPDDVDQAINLYQEAILQMTQRWLAFYVEESMLQLINDEVPMPSGRSCEVPEKEEVVTD